MSDPGIFRSWEEGREDVEKLLDSWARCISLWTRVLMLLIARSRCFSIGAKARHGYSVLNPV